MSNRKKRRFFKNTPQENRLEIASRGLAKVGDRPDMTGQFPTADEMFAHYSSKDLPPEELALLKQLQIPASEAEVIKVVDAKVDGVTVGKAFIHDDGQVSIAFDKDADPEALAKVKATAEMVGYDVGTGGINGSS